MNKEPGEDRAGDDGGPGCSGYGMPACMKERLVSENMHIVRAIAHRIAQKLPAHIDVNDLISAGTVGLVESAGRFDAARGVLFTTFASARVRGAIIDELRGMDRMTRCMRDKSRRIEKARSTVENGTGRPAEDGQVARLLGLEVDRFHDMLSTLAYSSAFDDCGAVERMPAPDAHDPAASAGRSQMMEKLADAVDRLPEKERVLIALYYYDGLNFKEVGSILDITESRACQLHAQTMDRLKASLKDASDG